MPRVSDVVLVVSCMFSGSSGVRNPRIEVRENEIFFDCDLVQNLLLIPSVERIYPLRSHNSVILFNCPLPNTTYWSDLMSLNINMTVLKHLSLTGIYDRRGQLRAHHFKGMSSLTFLEITNGIELTRLPADTALVNVTLGYGGFVGKWGGCRMMQRLTITEYYLDEMPEGWLSHCPTLSSLELIYVRGLTGAALQRVTSGLLELRELLVGGCGLFQLPGDWLADSRHLQRLDLSYNYLEKVRIIEFPELVELSLRGNKITGQEAVAMPLLQQRRLRILRLSSNRDLDLCKPDRINWRWIGHPTLEVLELSSTGSSELCFQKFASLQYLDLSYNNISKLNFNGIPVSRAPTRLVSLDENPAQEVLFDQAGYETTRGLRLNVSNNHLSQLEPEVVEALFSVSEWRVSLAGNPLVCECQLVRALNEHKSQVEDYEQVTCANIGLPIRDVVTRDLCKEPPGEALTVALVLCGVLVAFLALAAAAYCRYEREVKVFLYAHGCWLSCIHEEELDTDRRFDAFISFSHGDEDYIFDRLMPGLENEPNSYNVCVHYRDWVPGEFIPAQITHSVEQSRRTIIVLSSNYLASPWGLLEFRTAHEDTLKGGRPRIIVILLEDVGGDERLSSELRGYLRSNTYVKHDDPWFWRKLRYALPHRPAAGQSRQGTGGDVTRTAARRYRPVVQMEALREA